MRDIEPKPTFLNLEKYVVNVTTKTERTFEQNSNVFKTMGKYNLYLKLITTVL
jgi:hypothetical protein